jgi:hypothetical protein
MHRTLGRAALLSAFALGMAACGPRRGDVVVYTSVDQVFSEPVFRAFERETFGR